MKKAVCPYCGKKVERFIMYRGDVVGCEKCGIRAKRTNGDRIRAMSDEELAEFFQNTTFCDSCFIYKNGCGTESYSCIQRWLDWLREEVSDEGKT